LVSSAGLCFIDFDSTSALGLVKQQLEEDLENFFTFASPAAAAAIDLPPRAGFTLESAGPLEPMHVV
jgi:hypothetical protein